MDKKVLDLEESEVEVVYDIRLVLRNKKLYVTDVDTGKSARLRRFGLGRLTKIVSSDAKDDQMISWTYIQPLPTNIGSFKGDVKLKVLKENLAEIHPVDLADILEELDHDQRVAVFTSLENEHASDTLEEIEPNVQRDIIASLDIAKVVPLITTMTSGQAADVLSAIPHSQAEDILEAISPEMAKKVRAIMERQEEKVIHYTTQKILKFLPGNAGRVCTERLSKPRTGERCHHVHLRGGQKRTPAGCCRSQGTADRGRQVIPCRDHGRERDHP